MGTIGDSPCLGDVCRTPSADLGKSRWGFAIKHSSNMGVKGHLPHSGMYAGLLLQIWENLIGVWQSCILGNLGKMGINGRTPSAELSKPWRSS